MARSSLALSRVILNEACRRIRPFDQTAIVSASGSDRIVLNDGLVIAAAQQVPDGQADDPGSKNQGQGGGDFAFTQ